MSHESGLGHDSVIRLQIAGDDLRFSILENPDAHAVSSVSAGSISSVRGILRHEPATALELEAAIADVEDLIMPVMRSLPSDGVLEVEGCELQEVMGVLLSVEPEPASIQAVENLFNRLAKVAMGSPAGSQGVPVTASFALGLVVLREVMHHGGLHSVIRA